MRRASVWIGKPLRYRLSNEEPAALEVRARTPMLVATEIAYAKINLTLEIIGRRSDGMHELASIVAFAEFGDRLTLTPRDHGDAGPAELCVTGPFSEAIVGENLVVRALRQVEAAAGRSISADLSLEKLLPVASGIGGGSADAAAALRLVRASGLVGQASIDWEDIARGLGSDVPVCLASRPALMTGTGERLQPIVLPPLDVVLANAREGVPADKTRRVFQALGAGPIAGPSRQRLDSPLTKSALLALMRDVGNDLERAATEVLTGLAAVKTELANAAGCEIAFLSGAGPTIVGLFPSAEAARSAADDLAARHPSWWVTSSTTLAA